MPKIESEYYQTFDQFLMADKAGYQEFGGEAQSNSEEGSKSFKGSNALEVLR